MLAAAGANGASNNPVIIGLVIAFIVVVALVVVFRVFNGRK
ncbi:MAG: hypothetical protein JWM76_1573 [Pseudonocardiales bacterium]|nr:hypothetical protein [Pseudonocardiales bacterium]